MKKGSKSKKGRQNTKPLVKKKVESLVDFHTHSIGSNDGYYRIEKLIKAAKMNHLSYLAVTDHNSNQEILTYLRNANFNPSTRVYYDVKGIKVLPAVEVTARLFSVLNQKGNSSKFHFLVYGFDQRPESPMMRLLNIKRENDLQVDFMYLRHFSKLTGFEINQEFLREYIIDRRKEDHSYQTLSKEDSIFFLNKYYNGALRTNKELEELFGFCPYIERINIDCKDLIKIAHASGGVVMVAHPNVNLARTQNPMAAITELIEAGVDGFELAKGKFDGINYVRDIVKYWLNDQSDRKLMFCSGSDLHIKSNSQNLGVANGKPITEKDNAEFICLLEQMQQARIIEGFPPVESYQTAEIEELLGKYAVEKVDYLKQVEEMYNKNNEKFLGFNNWRIQQGLPVAKEIIPFSEVLDRIRGVSTKEGGQTDNEEGIVVLTEETATPNESKEAMTDEEVEKFLSPSFRLDDLAPEQN